MKTIAILCLVAAPIVFLVGCMMGLTHGYEAQGEMAMNASYVLAIVVILAAAVHVFYPWRKK